jgi:hypothetical protein
VVDAVEHDITVLATKADLANTQTLTKRDIDLVGNDGAPDWGSEHQSNQSRT